MLNRNSKRPNHKNIGSALAGVLATIIVFMTLVLALHHQQSTAQTSLLRSEGELRFREARNFAMRQRLFGESPPWGLKVGAEIQDTTPEQSNPITERYARFLFERTGNRWSGLPDLKAVDAAHAHRYLEVRATGFGGLAGTVKKGVYKTIETEIPGYAAYAPNGTIILGEVAGWQNPSYDTSTDATEAYSGVPAILGAHSDIEVSNLIYGEAHSRDGVITIEEGLGVGFVGNLPLPPYEDDLMGELQSATSTLAASTSSGDKTGSISNHSGIGDILDIAFGGSFNPEQLLSLRQAWNFETPMIPGASMVVPGVVWEIWLHVPFQPDLGFSTQHNPDLSRLDEISEEQLEAATLLDEARQELEVAAQNLEAAQAAYANNPNQANQLALAAAQSDYDDIIFKIEVIQGFLENSSAEAGDIASGMLGTGMSSLPQTRQEDPSGRNGQWGWNYSQTIGKMFDLVTTIAGGGDLKEIASSISSNVRVVHYGPEDEVPHFEWNGSAFVSTSTWTVPSSRTLRYDGNMEIRGDLWLQRGSVMVVNGNLRIESPIATPSLTDAFRPSGRVFFEEGSTLIVRGNFECQGSPHFGSIIVAGQPEEIHPITAALIVEGDVQIPNGVYTAHTLADLIAAIPFPGTEAGANTVALLLEQQAPLLSKLAGPFHLRAPYFARFATTFQLVTIPFPPIVAVTPIPSPKENLHVFAFRMESFAFTVGLNALLGENLYTQSDWWPFGNGVVPMALSLDLGAAVIAAGEARALEDSAELDPETLENEIRGFVETLEERTVAWAIEEGLQKLTNEIARILTPGGFGPIVDAVQTIINEVEGDEDAMDRFYQEFVGDFQGRMGDIGRNLLSRLLENTNVLDADQYLREYAGLLVFGRNISIGSNARQVSGMFIAEQDIVSDAHLTIGTLMSHHGSIRAGNFLYYPYFNQASLYVPSAVPGDSVLERAAFERYGAAHDSGVAVQVGPPPVTNHITMGGWDR